jgi:hypothetical protein
MQLRVPQRTSIPFEKLTFKDDSKDHPRSLSNRHDEDFNTESDVGDSGNFYNLNSLDIKVGLIKLPRRRITKSIQHCGISSERDNSTTHIKEIESNKIMSYSYSKGKIKK